MELGFDNVYTLEGGLKKWEKDHQSVEKGVPAPDAPSPARKP
jgi:3-mercaptopyruvate sulfurtransferase SseA